MRSTRGWVTGLSRLDGLTVLAPPARALPAIPAGDGALVAWVRLPLPRDMAPVDALSNTQGSARTEPATVASALDLFIHDHPRPVLCAHCS